MTTHQQLTVEQEDSLIRFEQERIQRCERILKSYEKPTYVREKHIHSPLTKKEIQYFLKMGCTVVKKENNTQQKLL